MPEQFDVFLCHNSQEKTEVEKIRGRLKQWGIYAWLDKYDFEPFRPWQKQLEEIIPQIKAVAIFIGSSGVGPWANIEMNEFLVEFANNKIRMGLVILPNCPDESIQAVPRFMRSFHWVDFRCSEPDPMEQLIWGITGYKLSEYRKHMQKKLDDLMLQRDIIEREIQEIEQRVKSNSINPLQVSSNLRVVLDWLKEGEIVAEKYGKSALSRFPDLRQEVKENSSLDIFYQEVTCYLDFICVSMETNNKIFLNELPLPPTLADLDLYKSACFDVYRYTFSLIKRNVPDGVDISIINKLSEHIEYLLKRLQVNSGDDNP